MMAADPPAEVRLAPAALYAAGVADRRAGRHEAALAAFDAVLAQAPDDVDARLNRGLTLLSLERLDPAAADFARVLELAPDYVDAHIGLAQVAQRRGDLVQARLAAAAAARAAPERADVQALQRALRGPPAWRVDLDVSRSALGAGLPDWTEVRVGAGGRVAPRWGVAVAGEWTERFGRSDIFAEARLDRRFTWGGLHAGLGAADKADYRPRTVLRGGGELRLGAAALTLEASSARFSTGDVATVQPGVAVEVGHGRLRLSARAIQLWDERDVRRSGYAVGAVWAATPALRARFDYADAPETSEGVTIDVRSVGVSGEWDVSEALSLRLGGLHEDRGAYDRRMLQIGVGRRFW
jgi:YaiO family outer membrane protein